MSVLRKVQAASDQQSGNDKLRATGQEKILADAEAELRELSDHSRPMLMENINEA